MTSALSKDRRQLLAILAAIAGVLWVSVGLAILLTEETRTTHARMNSLVLERFADMRADTQRIRFTLADETYTLARTAGGWVVEDAGGYPVKQDDPNRLGELMRGLETLSYGEMRTDDPYKHERIGLGDPTEGGNGALVEIFGPGEQLTHSLIIGRKSDALYFRDVDNAQTFRAIGTLPPFYNRRAWLDLKVIDIDPGAVRAVRIFDASDQTLYLSRREGEDSRSFRPAPPHEQDQLISRLAASTTALALTRLSPIDVKPASELTTSPISRHISETFDGLEVELLTYRERYGLWVTIEAIEAGEAARRAATINQRAAGWAFRITDYDFQDFTPSVQSIVDRDF